MKKTSLFLAAFLGLNINAMASTSLVQVYEQALVSDPVYQQAVAQRFATDEYVPINMAPLLPQAAINGGPLINKTGLGGTIGDDKFSSTSRGYSFTLTLTQTVFNYAQFKALSSARDTARQADASMNAAMQSLMLRVAQAYFAVLKDEDNLVYNASNKKAFSKQLDQINQQYKVGLKTTTDVYTSRASFDTAAANYIAAQTQLADDKENLRAITGELYPNLAKLSENFPLITPQPADMNSWVETAERQNWSIKAAQFANLAAMENVKQQRAGHFPTVSLQGSYNASYSNTLGPSASTAQSTASDAQPNGGNNVSLLPGPQHSTDASVALNLGIPIFQGGVVVAQTNQAKYNYQLASQQLEQTMRSTINSTRQSYMGIISGIRQIQADKQAIRSTISSLNGLNEGYRVGSQTLVDVLNQQQRVFQAQTQYASDRYAYINNLLTLKQAAGTLSEEDLQAINAWLHESSDDVDDEDNGYDNSRATDTYLYRYDTLKHKPVRAHQSKTKTKPATKTVATTTQPKIALAKLNTKLVNGPDLSLSP